MSRHDPEKRAEAATAPRFALPDPADLVGAAPGGKKPGGEWIPVRGPFLRTVCRREPRNRTGVPGISYGRASKGRGQKSYRYFFVQCGKRSRKFNITTLGKEIAWARALRCRAEHELRIREANARILAARETASQPSTLNSQHRE